jgi:tetratricopeptide (TPR) repeat protein
MSDRRQQAAIYAAAAQQSRNAGDFYDALLQQRRAVTLLRDIGDPAALAHAIRHLADILVADGQAREAAESITEMLTLYRATPDAQPLDIANAMRSAAVHAEAIGDNETARAFWIQARDRYAALDDVFERLTGSPGNPGVAEANAKIASLRF